MKFAYIYIYIYILDKQGYFFVINYHLSFYSSQQVSNIGHQRIVLLSKVFGKRKKKLYIYRYIYIKTEGETKRERERERGRKSDRKWEYPL